ncbi:MAG: peptidoglycan-binding protein [Candidatus Acidiferrales bacterium]
MTQLQNFLIQQHAGPAVQRLEAHATSQLFGFLTYNALKEFQASVGIRATGYFGPITRTYVNAHL